MKVGASIQVLLDVSIPIQLVGVATKTVTGWDPGVVLEPQQHRVRVRITGPGVTALNEPAKLDGATVKRVEVSANGDTGIYAIDTDAALRDDARLQFTTPEGIPLSWDITWRLPSTSTETLGFLTLRVDGEPMAFDVPRSDPAVAKRVNALRTVTLVADPQAIGNGGQLHGIQYLATTITLYDADHHAVNTGKPCLAVVPPPVSGHRYALEASCQALDGAFALTDSLPKAARASGGWEYLISISHDRTRHRSATTRPGN
jgi:hypothetical protein